MDKLEEFENAIKQREIVIQKRVTALNSILLQTQRRNWLLTSEFDTIKDRIRNEINQMNNQSKQLDYVSTDLERQINEMIEILNNNIQNYKKYYDKFNKLFEKDNFAFQQRNDILSSDLKNFQLNLSKMKMTSFNDNKLDLQQFVNDSSQFISNVINQIDNAKVNKILDPVLSNKTKDLSESLKNFEDKYFNSKENDCVDTSLAIMPNSTNILMKNDRILQKLNDSNLYPLDVKMSNTYYSMCDNDTSNNLMFPTRSEGANSELIAATEVLRSMSNLTLNYDDHSTKEVRKRHANLTVKKK